MKVGDKVHWTYISTRGLTISMSRREGEIVAIDGQVATVKKPSGRTEQVALKRLRPLRAKSQVTEFVEAMRAAHRS